MSRGKLIVIEGAPETGKQDQAELLRNHLRKKLGITAMYEGNLRGSDFDAKSLDLLKGVTEEATLSKHLLRAARLAHRMETIVSPSLELGENVIMTRSWLSIAVENPLSVSALKRRQADTMATYGQFVQPDLLVLLLAQAPNRSALSTRYSSTGFATIDARYGVYATDPNIHSIIVDARDVLQFKIQNLVETTLGITP
ncbi:hypothetical protein H7171_02025 [Candidatus Saccharibacteria bacterium]|nr:hypothetical protein [Candidatus Saccharibacteria bacterium]